MGKTVSVLRKIVSELQTLFCWLKIGPAKAQENVTEMFENTKEFYFDVIWGTKELKKKTSKTLYV